MAKIHDDTSKSLETEPELMAIYHLIKKVGIAKAGKVLREINYYPNAKTHSKAINMVNAEKNAMAALNNNETLRNFFSKT